MSQSESSHPANEGSSRKKSKKKKKSQAQNGQQEDLGGPWTNVTNNRRGQISEMQRKAQRMKEEIDNRTLQEAMFDGPERSRNARHSRQIGQDSGDRDSQQSNRRGDPHSRIGRLSGSLQALGISPINPMYSLQAPQNGDKNMPSWQDIANRSVGSPVQVTRQINQAQPGQDRTQQDPTKVSFPDLNRDNLTYLFSQQHKHEKSQGQKPNTANGTNSGAKAEPVNAWSTNLLKEKMKDYDAKQKEAKERQAGQFKVKQRQSALRQAAEKQTQAKEPTSPSSESDKSESDSFKRLESRDAASQSRDASSEPVEDLDQPDEELGFELVEQASAEKSSEVAVSEAKPKPEPEPEEKDTSSSSKAGAELQAPRATGPTAASSRGTEPEKAQTARSKPTVLVVSRPVSQSGSGSRRVSDMADSVAVGPGNAEPLSGRLQPPEQERGESPIPTQPKKESKSRQRRSQAREAARNEEASNRLPAADSEASLRPQSRNRRGSEQDTPSWRDDRGVERNEPSQVLESNASQALPSRPKPRAQQDSHPDTGHREPSMQMQAAPQNGGQSSQSSGPPGFQQPAQHPAEYSQSLPAPPSRQAPRSEAGSADYGDARDMRTVGRDREPSRDARNNYAARLAHQQHVPLNPADVSQNRQHEAGQQNRPHDARTAGSQIRSWWPPLHGQDHPKKVLYAERAMRELSTGEFVNLQALVQAVYAGRFAEYRLAEQCFCAEFSEQRGRDLCRYMRLEREGKVTHYSFPKAGSTRSQAPDMEAAVQRMEQAGQTALPHGSRFSNSADKEGRSLPPESRGRGLQQPGTTEGGGALQGAAPPVNAWAKKPNLSPQQPPLQKTAATYEQYRSRPDAQSQDGAAQSMNRAQDWREDKPATRSEAQEPPGRDLRQFHMQDTAQQYPELPGLVQLQQSRPEAMHNHDLTGFLPRDVRHSEQTQAYHLFQEQQRLTDPTAQSRESPRAYDSQGQSRLADPRTLGHHMGAHPSQLGYGDGHRQGSQGHDFEVVNHFNMQHLPQGFPGRGFPSPSQEFWSSQAPAEAPRSDVQMSQETEDHYNSQHASRELEFQPAREDGASFHSEAFNLQGNQSADNRGRHQQPETHAPPARPLAANLSRPSAPPQPERLARTRPQAPRPGDTPATPVSPRLNDQDKANDWAGQVKIGTDPSAQAGSRYRFGIPGMEWGENIEQRALKMTGSAHREWLPGYPPGPAAPLPSQALLSKPSPQGPAPGSYAAKLEEGEDSEMANVARVARFEEAERKKQQLEEGRQKRMEQERQRARNARPKPVEAQTKLQADASAQPSEQPVRPPRPVYNPQKSSQPSETAPLRPEPTTDQDAEGVEEFMDLLHCSLPKSPARQSSQEERERLGPVKLQGPVRLNVGNQAAPDSGPTSPTGPRSWANIAQSRQREAGLPRSMPPQRSPTSGRAVDDIWSHVNQGEEQEQLLGKAGRPPRALAPRPISNGHGSEADMQFLTLTEDLGSGSERDVDFNLHDLLPPAAPEQGPSQAEEEAWEDPVVEETRAALNEDQKAELRDLLEHYSTRFAGRGLQFQPRGLVNGGNICFMNSILQALMASGPFCLFLKHLQSIRPALLSQKEPGLFCLAGLAEEYEPVPELQQSDSKSAEGPPPSVWASTSVPLSLGGKAVSPDMMSTILSRFNPRSVPTFRQGRGRPMAKREQEDAQEFLGYLLDTLHEELLSLKTTLKEDLQLKDVAEAPEDSDGDGWMTQKKGNKKALTQETGLKSLGTFIHDFVKGECVTQVKASGPQSDTIQPFTVVNLDVCPHDVTDISDAIKKYTEYSLVEDYKLEKGDRVTAKIRMMFMELPKLLILVLNRFTYDATMQATKVHKAVRFDTKLRVNREWLADESPQKKRPLVYDLVSVVTHLGTTSNSGHYIAHALQRPSGKWLKFDDQNVSSVPVHKVLEEPAYVLFYQLSSETS